MHTPGPWRYTPWHIEEGHPTVRAPAGWLICETSSDANAQLMALAPEFYVFAQEISIGAYTLDEASERARELIRKATPA